MIKICDEIMGSGKTSAAINYMNQNCKTRNFLYVTPFIDEAQRIVDACPSLKFWMPRSDLKEYEFKKRQHLKELLIEHRNVAITHKLLSMCDDETTKYIAGGNYTVIIDEAVDVFNPFTISSSDINILTSSGWLVRKEDDSGCGFECYERDAQKEYLGGRYHDLFLMAKSNRLVNISDDDSQDNFWMWSLNKEILTCSEDTYVLTYLFKYSFLRCYMDINHIDYGYIHIHKSEDKTYEFSDDETIPEYTASLSEKIHIFENANSNKIGDNKNALSYSWVKRESQKSDGKLEQLRKNINTFFQYHHGDIPSSERLWSTYDCGVAKLRSKGHYRSDLAFNSKATNNYSNKRVLAYCVNIFCNPSITRYFSANGVSFDEDGYALSIMIQWIWRSAIRNGEEIWIYIPSKRMRTLLKKWIKEVESNYIHIKGEPK